MQLRQPLQITFKADPEHAWAFDRGKAAGAGELKLKTAGLRCGMVDALGNRGNQSCLDIAQKSQREMDPVQWKPPDGSLMARR